jgi:hypothetical protein
MGVAFAEGGGEETSPDPVVDTALEDTGMIDFGASEPSTLVGADAPFGEPEEQTLYGPPPAPGGAGGAPAGTWGPLSGQYSLLEEDSAPEETAVDTDVDTDPHTDDTDETLCGPLFEAVEAEGCEEGAEPYALEFPVGFLHEAVPGDDVNDVPSTFALPWATENSGSRCFEVIEVRSPYPGMWSLVARGTEDWLDTVVLVTNQGVVEGYISGQDGWFHLSGEVGEPACLYDETDPDDSTRDHDTGLSDETGSMELLGGFLDTGDTDVPETWGYSTILDVLFVADDSLWGLTGWSPPRVSAAIVASAVHAQEAFRNHQLPVAIRVVGIETITDWTYGNRAADEHTCFDRKELKLSTQARMMRTQYGADIVVGLVPPADGGGCANAVQFPAGQDENGYITLEGDADGVGLAHEIGHVAGLGHDFNTPANAEGCTWGTARSACGYSFTNDQRKNCYTTYDTDGCGDTDPCDPPDEAGEASYMGQDFYCWYFDRSVKDIMSKRGGFDRLNLYSDADLEIQRSSASPSGRSDQMMQFGTRIDHPTKTSGNLANAADRLRQTLPKVAEYRRARAPLLGDELTAPVPGSNLPSGSNNFTWTASATTTQNYLEVYRAKFPGSPAYDGVATSPESVTIPGSPAMAKVIAARFWTRYGTSDWVWRDYRYNIENQLVSCSAEEEPVLPAPKFAYEKADCEFSSAPPVPYCAWDAVAQTVSCDLRDDGPPASTSPRARAVARVAPWSRIYDVAIYGEARSGERFCCLWYDKGDLGERLEVLGTDLADDLGLHDLPFQLEPYDGTSLVGRIDAQDRGDLVQGSYYEDADYEDRLLGRCGRDTIRAMSGADIVAAGMHADRVDAGSGDDRVTTGRGTDVANGREGNDVMVDGRSPSSSDIRLVGGPGDDTLCAGNPQSILIGNKAPTSEMETLWWSSGGTLDFTNSTANSALAECGHSSYGSTPANYTICDVGDWTLTSEPAECGLIP